MANSLDKSPVSDDSLTAIIGSNNFNQLSESNQKIIIESLTTKKQNESGLLGKIFGEKRSNATVNIAFALCLILLCIGVFAKVQDNPLWDKILTIVAATIGYMFGKSQE